MMENRKLCPELRIPRLACVEILPNDDELKDFSTVSRRFAAFTMSPHNYCKRSFSIWESTIPLPAKQIFCSG
jgi:hypothetical protein